MLKSLLMGSVAALFATGAAFADVDAWDANQDGMIDADEFSAGMEEDDTFGFWDENEDDEISPDEYSAGMEEDDGLFDTWDEDASGTLSRDEWQAGTWDQYDADKDDMWDAEEAGGFRDMVTRVGSEVSQ